MWTLLVPLVQVLPRQHELGPFEILRCVSVRAFGVFRFELLGCMGQHGVALRWSLAFTGFVSVELRVMLISDLGIC